MDILAVTGYADWGYPVYQNPYYVTIDNSVVDYSQPLAEPTDDAVSEPGMQYFDSARAAFKQGDYNRALQLVDSALVTMPLDSVLHEFRALILFAQGKYREAASVMHPVLLAGPGWNWSTLLGLYPDVEVYTAQLRALEQYRNEHKQSAETRFLLAYQYLTCGHQDAAIKELKKVVALQPSDQLSRRLLEQLTGESVPTTTPVPPQSEPAADEQFTQPIPVPPQAPEQPMVVQPQKPAEDKTVVQPKLDAPGEEAEKAAGDDPQPILAADPKTEKPADPKPETPAEPQPVPEKSEPTPPANAAEKYVGTLGMRKERTRLPST